MSYFTVEGLRSLQWYSFLSSGAFVDHYDGLNLAQTSFFEQPQNSECFSLF